MTSVIWFRRDLRLHDHPALHAAIAEGPVASLFVIDDNLIERHAAAARRIEFMFRCLEALDGALRARGGRIQVRRGRPADIVPAFAAEVGADAVHVSRDYTPFARRRDAAVLARLAAEGRTLVEHEGVLVHEPEAVARPDQRPHRSFGAFQRRWAAQPLRPVLPAPAAIRAPAGPAGGFPSRAGRPAERSALLPAAGETAARARLSAWAAGPVSEYAARRDRLDLEGTSRLSQDLRWGLVSAREVIAATDGPGDGRAKFRAELAWRDFAYYVLWQHPAATWAPIQEKYAGIAWPTDADAFAAWCDGRTGYPVVDAAMHELAATGWLSNRARMIVASFLAKDLLIDWRLGQAHFMRHLLDGDVANNAAGWQWSSSMGLDAQPYFRIFNPVAQGERSDPAGDYVRRWLPSLARVPGTYIHAPWSMPRAVQDEAACVLGRDYPWPIVNHAEARQRALAFFRSSGANA